MKANAILDMNEAYETAINKLQEQEQEDELRKNKNKGKK